MIISIGQFLAKCWEILSIPIYVDGPIPISFAMVFLFVMFSSLVGWTLWRMLQ